MRMIKNWLYVGTGLTLIGKIVVSLFVILCVFVITRVFYVIVKRLFKRSHLEIHDAKTKTLIRVILNVLKFIVYFWGLMIILDLFGVNTTSLIATAGIGGIALGFGAQSMVKDVISGGFLLFEDQFSLGDYIRVNDMEGFVIETGLRVTKLKAFSGEIHIIPNGNIPVVTNISRSPARALIEVKIPDTVNLDQAIGKLREAMERHGEEVDFFTEKPEPLGLTGNLEFSGILTIVGYTQPMRQWEAEREMRRIAHEVITKLKNEGEKHGGAINL